MSDGRLMTFATARAELERLQGQQETIEKVIGPSMRGEAIRVVLAECDLLRTTLARAAYVAGNLHGMIDRQTWRDHGADDGQGHHEGDYHAEHVQQEIEAWTELAGEKP